MKDNFDLKKFLTEGRLVKENIGDVKDVETVLNELVQEYVNDMLDTAGEDNKSDEFYDTFLDLGDGKIGYKNKKDLIQDFILYLESTLPFVK